MSSRNSRHYWQRHIHIPIVALPKLGRTYMVDCDSKAYAVGAILIKPQEKENAKESATVGYWKKMFTNYPAI